MRELMPLTTLVAVFVAEFLLRQATKVDDFSSSVLVSALAFSRVCSHSATTMQACLCSRLIADLINIAGGLRVTDLATDLSVISAVLSSNVDTPIEPGWCMAGEVGLSGEVRPIARIEQRIAEAEKLGFSHIIIPRYNMQGLNTKKFKIELCPVRKVEEALRLLFG